MVDLNALIRTASVSVADVKRSTDLYCEWLQYDLVEEGGLDEGLAEAIGAPRSAGKPYSLLRPASGVSSYIRFVENDPVPEYQPLRSYGWNAMEICISDLDAVNARMEKSPFEIIGPPAAVGDISEIMAMQVKGPDKEIVYFTQISADPDGYSLPRATSLIDHLFIMVAGFSNVADAAAWFEDKIGLEDGQHMDIPYNMVSGAYGLPADTLHTLGTMMHKQRVFLELDQYPDAAVARPHNPGLAPPGIFMAGFATDAFDDVASGLGAEALKLQGAAYNGKRSLVTTGPDGMLVEIIED